MLAIECRSSERTASVFYHWAMSLAPSFWSFILEIRPRALCMLSTFSNTKYCSNSKTLKIRQCPRQPSLTWPEIKWLAGAFKLCAVDIYCFCAHNNNVLGWELESTVCCYTANYPQNLVVFVVVSMCCFKQQAFIMLRVQKQVSLMIWAQNLLWLIW